MSNRINWTTKNVRGQPPTYVGMVGGMRIATIIPEGEDWRLLWYLSDEVRRRKHKSIDHAQQRAEKLYADWLKEED